MTARTFRGSGSRRALLLSEGVFTPEYAILYLLRDGHAAGKIAYDASRMESESELATF